MSSLYPMNTQEEMGALVTKHDMKAPVTGNDLTPPCEFNLMFQISIGPTGKYFKST